MAIKMTRYSDMSGEPIPEGQAVRVRIEFLDGGQTLAQTADLSREEAAKLLPFAEEVEPRPGGRRPRRVAGEG